MAKFALVGLITVCLTVLSFSGMMQERLCSLSIVSSIGGCNTLVKSFCW
ncbi:hypothetical protein [Providencia sp.]